MRYLYIILFILSYLPTQAANVLAQRDSSIYVVRGNMQRLQDELIVSFELSVDRDLTSNESIVLEPMVQDTMGRVVILPKIYINSRRQYVMLQRGFYKNADMSNSLLRKNGTQQRLHYLEALPYSRWMASASLVVNEESCGCGVPISNNIAFTTDITTPYSLPAELPPLPYVVPEETDLKVRYDKGSAFILFKVNKTVIDPTFGNNQSELDKIINSIDLIQQDTTSIVTGVSIHGYASPEGPYKLNDRLSKGRTNAIKEYVDKLYDFPQDIFNTDNTAEDWEGFEALLQGSSYKYKSEILKIINSDISLDKKESEIKTKYPEFFKMLLDDWFIMLRHTDYIIEYEVCFFNTIEQIEQIFKTKPYNLSLNELFQLSQSYEKESEECDNVLMKSVLLYPNDPIANLNAACVALRRRDVVAAKRYLNLSFECAEKDLAMGVYYLLIEEYDIANDYFKQIEPSEVPEVKQYVLIYQAMTR